jgi:hypothetical protein
MNEESGVLGDRARRRGPTRLSDAIAATGGIGVATGVLFIAIDAWWACPARSRGDCCPTLGASPTCGPS